jgi:hypothetical protein
MSLGFFRPGAAAAILVAVSTAGCSDLEGRVPPAETEFYFPTGLVTSPGGTTLYVANSDFDLKFQSGWVQAIDLKALRDKLGIITSLSDDPSKGEELLRPELLEKCYPTAALPPTDAVCCAAELGRNPDPWLNPGPCSPLSALPFVKNTRFIGGFASGIMLTHNPNPGPKEDGARLFVPVRGDPSVTYFKVQDDRGADAAFKPSFLLSCDETNERFCGDAHRIGRDADDTKRGITLPADPVGIAASANGEAIVVAHQTQQSASLLTNKWGAKPELAYFAQNLPPGPTEVAPIPLPGFVAQLRAQDVADRERALCETPPGGEPSPDCLDYKDGFMVTFRSAAQIDTLRVFSDVGGSRPFLVRADSTAISATRSNFDSRGVAFVDDERKACEATCTSSTELVSCMLACAQDIPLRIYMANRGPSSLLIGRTDTIVNEMEVNVEVNGELVPELVPTSAFEQTFFHDSVPLAFGPSRVETGKIVQADGTLATRVFVVCFDSRVIFVFDPVLERIELVVRTGRGPHDIAIDSGVNDEGDAYSMLYVGHFTDSYIGAVDLDMRRAATYGQMIATIGVPVPPVDTR